MALKSKGYMKTEAAVMAVKGDVRNDFYPQAHYGSVLTHGSHEN